MSERQSVYASQQKCEDIATDLAASHWEYVESVIRADYGAFGLSGIDLEAVLKIVGHHYRTAFVHGYKHGVDHAVPKM